MAQSNAALAIDAGSGFYQREVIGSDTPRLVLVRVEDRSGVLQRITNCLGRRGLRLLSCAVGQGPEAGILSLWIRVGMGGQPADQVVKQLSKLIDVVSVEDRTNRQPVEWVTALVEIRTDLDGHRIDTALRERGLHVLERREGSVLTAVSGTPQDVDGALAGLSGLPIIDWILSRPISLGGEAPDRGAGTRSNHEQRS
ncbi:MAG: ACT domain-containing protein [Candidatus Dormibacteria bacterium]